MLEQPQDNRPEGDSDLEREHSERFRRVSSRYPRRVAEAYEGDIARAATDSDEQVAAIVAEWEQEQGLMPRDWQAIGREERGDDDRPTPLGSEPMSPELEARLRPQARAYNPGGVGNPTASYLEVAEEVHRTRRGRQHIERAFPNVSPEHVRDVVRRQAGKNGLSVKVGMNRENGVFVTYEPLTDADDEDDGLSEEDGPSAPRNDGGPQPGLFDEVAADAHEDAEPIEADE